MFCVGGEGVPDLEVPGEGGQQELQQDQKWLRAHIQGKLLSGAGSSAFFLVAHKFAKYIRR